MMDTRLIGDCTVSRIGFGGAALGGLFAPVSAEDTEAALQCAWRAGVRLFDTAPLYGFGLSERRMGDFLRTRPRDSFVLSTKVGRLLRPGGAHHPQRNFYKTPMPFEPLFDYSYDGVMRSFEDSLQRLGLERIDIALLHDIGSFTHGKDAHPALLRQAVDGGLRALQELRESGVVRALGIGVNECGVCEEVMDAVAPDCILLAGRYTLLEQDALDSLLPRCQREGVALLIGGVFNSGVLVATEESAQTYDYQPAGQSIRARAAAIRRLCARHGTTAEAAGLHFPAAHPAVAAVLIGARDAAQTAFNLEQWKTPPPPALWRELRAEQLIRADAPLPPASSVD